MLNTTIASAFRDQSLGKISLRVDNVDVRPYAVGESNP